MPITATASPILTTVQGAPSRVASPQEIRRLHPEMELLAKDIEELSRQLNRLKQQLSTVAPDVSVVPSGFSGVITVRNSAGTGTSTITVVDGLVTAYAP